MAKRKKPKGGTPSGNPRSGTSNYLRKTDYSKLDEAGYIGPKTQTKHPKPKGNKKKK